MRFKRKRILKNFSSDNEYLTGIETVRSTTEYKKMLVVVNYQNVAFYELKFN